MVKEIGVLLKNNTWTTTLVRKSYWLQMGSPLSKSQMEVLIGTRQGYMLRDMPRLVELTIKKCQLLMKK